MKIPDFMINNLLPDAAKKWHAAVTLYYMKTFK
jgi:hypothetical protein